MNQLSGLLSIFREDLNYAMKTFFLLFFSACVGNAQVLTSNPGQISSSNPQRNETISRVRLFSALDMYNFPRESAGEVRGTPYLSDNYQKGNIYSTKGSFFEIEMRYNIYYDRFEFNRNDSVYAITPDAIITKVELNGNTFIVADYPVKGKMLPGYFVRLDSGKLTLLRKMAVLFRPGEENKPMHPEGVPARYDRMPDIFYYRIGEGTPTNLRSIKRLIEDLPDKKSEMQQFADTEEISSKKTEELIKFAQHYNSLQKN